ncbi:MAG TPA: bifunctional isocitrate dehydrogenase kinase/phosphatase [Gemmatimonadales bacterium]|nr:bifunctional isocitrate dehydrogenase kinase/phosphatase [Gemmatimonadales bacterium]
MNSNTMLRPIAPAVSAIQTAYEEYARGFNEITARARSRFEQRDWSGAQSDATARLELYKTHVDAAVSDVHDILSDAVMERTVWAAMKADHASRVAQRADAELAATFFNSVTRKVFSTVGVDPAIEYLDTGSPPYEQADEPPVYETYTAPMVGAELVRRMLLAYSWSVPYAQLDRDTVLVAELIQARVREAAGDGNPIEIDLLRSVFYRNKGAYLVGRIRSGEEVIPLVLPLLHAERGIVVDAVLMTSDEASVVFGFSWTYFRVDAPRPRALVRFLGSIMPLKQINELYTAIGYNKHGKTELYRGLMRHLEASDARFAFVEGDEGMVMAVFTLPSFNVVFKVIKDSFGAPKNTTRRAVMAKYQFVFIRDRVGRLADAQEFEHLEFPRRCFPDELLEYLVSVAGTTIRVEGETVVVRHLYTERRVTPLNLFLRDAHDAPAREAVLDFGNAIKDLAAANIFTGDMLLKNFGVSRHGRVICYDYDELSPLSECRFRRIPPPVTPEDELSAEPWFYVGEQDVFPEEFAAFLVPAGELREVFLEAHGDLLDIAFWHDVQQRLARGEVVDVFPYRREARLQRHGREGGKRRSGKAGNLHRLP